MYTLVGFELLEKLGKGPEVRLEELFDVLDLEQAVDAGFVRVQAHPDLPLRIFNYTELAQFERVWTPVTKQCRGLIVDAKDNVLARPFRKTHNHNEPEAHVFGLDEPVQVTDKVDGSLGIGYPTEDEHGYAIATRGSFASEQAQHATAVWRDRYADAVRIPDGVTPLWEIVYPTNRIVVDYHGQDDLVLLAGVVIETGEQLSAQRMAKEMAWTGPVVEEFPFGRFAEALAAEPRPGREGYVIRSLETGASVKYKYAEYVELHKLVTGMNERVVWEHLGAGKPVASLIEPLPDEFHRWVEDVAARLLAEAEHIRDRAQRLHDGIKADLPNGWGRKEYALAAVKRGGDLRPWLFNLLDGRDPWPGIWKTIRPSGAVTMSSYTEDAA